VALAILIQTFNWLGLPVAWEKLEGPTTSLTLLGLEIGSIALELREVVGVMPDSRQLAGQDRLPREGA